MNAENQAAFPIPASDGYHPAEAGMTLRDYFAAKAMQGILEMSVRGVAVNVPQACRDAYGIADEMLKAREK